MLSILIIMILAVPAAFICAARDFHGRELLEGWILSTRMMPALVVVLPFFLLFRNLNMLDTMLAPIAILLIAARKSLIRGMTFGAVG
ncbi:hypothetical protein [Paracoccus sp. IB05]|uniref:hypothetical protein n=1 Tax=Paracoccus sp. IB05 TaxID=2779367 RepID=UPI0018E84C29|nr:hypothetical protein [Paracoccus sp. IB05]MBJ2152190.1 hypothetical protein [Paracoccus sp. IB05]